MDSQSNTPATTDTPVGVDFEELANACVEMTDDLGVEMRGAIKQIDSTTVPCTSKGTCNCKLAKNYKRRPKVH